MKVQCAWCKKWGPDKAPFKDESVSHGICPACASKMAKKNPRKAIPHSVSHGTCLTCAINSTKKNPSEKWHAGKMEEAEASEKAVNKASLKDFYHGKAIAHFESALAERATKKRVRPNPIGVFGLGNPPKSMQIKIEGVIYNRCVEVRAEKTGAWEKGLWKHPFAKSSQVRVLGLDNGDILLHSAAGVRLWKKA